MLNLPRQLQQVKDYSLFPRLRLCFHRVHEFVFPGIQALQSQVLSQRCPSDYSEEQQGVAVLNSHPVCFGEITWVL